MKKRTSSIWMAITLVAGAATFVSLSGRSLDGRWGGNPVLAFESREDNAPRGMILEASQNREDNAPRSVAAA